jgi:preprotein translocase subunit YajC
MQEILGTWGMIIFLVAMFAIMYFLMIRPKQKQQKQHEAMLKELKPGDRVLIAGGIFAQIESLSEDTAIVKVESGATMKVIRNAILGKQKF